MLVGDPAALATKPRSGAAPSHVGRRPVINLTTLLDPAPPPPDDVRYGTHRPAGARRPVVAWTVTRSCNLACRHCYSASINHRYPGELSDDEAFAFIDDLVAMPATALLLSGGEPTMHPRLPEFAHRASDAGLRVTLSTNGTFAADPGYADELADAGLRYIGVSFDGVGSVHDDFRGVEGAFAQSLAGIRNLRARGVRVGLRMTLTKTATPHIDEIFDLVRREGFGRICFYHFVPSGRGRAAQAEALTHEESRWAVDKIIEFADDLRTEAPDAEVLTVANSADGPRLLQWLAARGRPTDAAEARLARVGGNRSGKAIAHVTNTGDVHPDQFSWGVKVGSIRERPFSEIWADESGLLGELRTREQRLSGRCASCRYLPLCGGSMRARAKTAGDGAWGSDPGCYLTDAEIAA